MSPYLISGDGSVALTGLWFTLGIFVLGYFDIWLPRGDAFGVSGALSVGALLVLEQPRMAVMVIVLGTVAALLARPSEARLSHVLAAAAAELAGVVAAMSVILLSNAVFGSMAVGALAATAYLLVELVVRQALAAIRSRRVFGQLVVGNLRTQWPLLASQVSSVLLLVVIYDSMGDWSLVLVTVLLLLIRQSYALLWGIRETYRATVEVLVEAAEGGNQRLRGHAERTAHIAREIAHGCGLGSRDVERISYAALLHDVDALGSETGEGRHRRSSELLEGVGLFRDVVAILEIQDGSVGQQTPRDRDLLAAYIVALASDLDMCRTPQLRDLGHGNSAERLARLVPPQAKARAAATAIRLGYGVPALS